MSNSIPEHNIITDQLIRIFGMRRSGNHAIIYWLRQHESDNHFFNDVNVPFNAYSVIKRLRMSLPYNKKLTLVSWENKPIDAEIYLKNIDFTHQKTILIMRDPFNWLASYFQKRWGVNNQLMTLYMDHLIEYIGETNRLGDKVTINYNRWFVDKEYRQSIIQKLGFDKLNDSALNYVPNEGGGSSFDGTKFQGNGHKMDVLRRWTNYVHKPEYNKWLKWPRLMKFTQRIWPKLYQEYQNYYNQSSKNS